MRSRRTRCRAGGLSAGSCTLVTRCTVPVLALALLAQPLATAPVEAQDRSITWTEATRYEAPGTLGAVLQAVPGGLSARESAHGIHIMGRKIRQDQGGSSTIIDLDEGRWVSIDHDAGTYTSASVEETTAMAREMGEILHEAMAGADEAADELRDEYEEAMAEMRRMMDEAGAEMDVRVSTRTTGEQENIGPYRAERHLVVAEVEIREAVTGVEEAGEGGTLVFLMDLWQSPDFPSADHLYEEWARQVGEDPELQALGREMAESMEPVAGALGPEALAAWDPRIAAGLEQLVEVAGSLEGKSLRSVVTVAVVPDGADLDESALLAWEPESMGDRLRAEAGGAAREAARDAVRGGIRGVLGRGAPEEPEEAPEEEAGVRPVIRVTNEVRNIRDEARTAADLYEVDPSYREIPLPDLEELRRGIEPR